MQATPRKTHKKTRSGCVQCKRRKVKCGEEGCPCKNCIRRGLTCTYTRSESSGTPDTVAESPHPSPATTQQPDHPAAESQHDHSGLNRQEELCLVHHYATGTCLGQSRNGSDEHAEIWRDMPFHDGLTYGFVLEAVLAVAALHKAYMEPQHAKKYMSACLYYQNQCLCAYNKELANINEDNCHAIFAVSALVHVLNIAISRGGPTLLPTPPIETLLLQFQLTRGIMIVLSTTWQTVTSAHYKGLFKIPGANTPTNAVNTPEVVYAMEELKRCTAEAKSTDKDVLEMYHTAVEGLENHFRHVEQGGDQNVIIAWPINLNSKAEQLLADRDPLMMLICVHYGVLCLHVHDRWWAHNFGCRLIWDLSESLHALDASWLPLTSWARSKAASVRAASADLKLW